MGNKIASDVIMLTNQDIFGDAEEHDYQCFCKDGQAVCVPHNDNEPFLILEYPTIAEVLADDDLSRNILEYCGLFGLTNEDICPTDVAVYCGKPKKI